MLVIHVGEVHLGLFSAIWPARICSFFRHSIYFGTYFRWDYHQIRSLIHNFVPFGAFSVAILHVGTSLWALVACNYGNLAGLLFVFLLKITLKKPCAGLSKLGRWPHDYCLLRVELHLRMVCAVCVWGAQVLVGFVFVGLDDDRGQSLFFRTPHLHTTGIVNDCAVCSSSNIVCLCKVACAPVGAVYVTSRARQPTGTA